MTLHRYYYLENKINGAIFYVGYTKKELSYRLKQHIYQSKIKDGNRNQYIRSWGEENIAIKLIETIGDSEFYFDHTHREKYWILSFYKAGHPLTNETIGWMISNNYQFKYVISLGRECPPRVKKTS